MYIAVAAICATGIVACGPSNDEVTAAVRKSLEQNVPSSLSRFMLGGRDAKIDHIRVVKTGSKQKGLFGEEYWPVMVHVKGSCTTAIGGVSLERRHFDKEVKFLLTKDDFGKYQAQSPMP